MLKDWSDAYRTGIAEIDHQHQGFFEATHRLHDRILNCQGEHGVEEAIESLRDYAARHFKAEEALMRRDAFPGLERHQRLHAAFFDRLDRLVYELRVYGPSQHLAEQALEVAQDWLADHIACEDQQYAEHLRRDRG
jgi:hemerythrin